MFLLQAVDSDIQWIYIFFRIKSLPPTLHNTNNIVNIILQNIIATAGDTKTGPWAPRPVWHTPYNSGTQSGSCSVHFYCINHQLFLVYCKPLGLNDRKVCDGHRPVFVSLTINKLTWRAYI